MESFTRANHPELITPEHDQIRAKRDAMPIIQIDRLTLSDGTIVERSMFPIPFRIALENVATSYDGGDPALDGNVPPEYVSDGIDVDEDLRWKSATFVRMDKPAQLPLRSVPVIAIPEEFRWIVAVTVRERNDDGTPDSIATVKTNFVPGHETLNDAVDFVSEWFALYDDQNLGSEISMTIIVPGGNAAVLVNIAVEEDTNSYIRQIEEN